MLEQDFNKLKEISKELNEIRLRNNLIELQLKAEDNSFISWRYNQVMLLTRGKKKYDCKINHMRHNKDTNEFEDMDYNKYLNYK